MAASTCGRAAKGCTERPSGTNTSCIAKSFDPVPRRPEVNQVSRISTSARGAKARWKVPSSIVDPPVIQWQCWVPLPHIHRPVTR